MAAADMQSWAFNEIYGIGALNTTGQSSILLREHTDSAVQSRCIVTVDGQIQWGAGGSGASANQDTFLQRVAAGVLSLGTTSGGTNGVILGGSQSPIYTYTVAAAITQKSGTIMLNTTSIQGFSLPVPVSGPASSGGDDGKTLTIINETNYANTVSNSPALIYNGGHNTTATFGAAYGATLSIRAVSGYWWVTSTQNVTVS